ncbi:flavodoxin domain-containing protein, partial [Variovorax sp. KK3]
MDEALRHLAAAASVLLYGALCAATWRRERRRARALAEDAASLAGTGAPVLVLHASQTGQAETIAWQTARWLHARGAAVQVKSLNEIDLATLQAAVHALFVTSTYGEGDPPDGASAFVERVMGARAQLAHLRYALLALGDRQYAHFCGFGRRLDGWLRDSGAVPSHERIDVDNGDDAALARWRGQWQAEGAHVEVDGDGAAGEAFQPWRLRARKLLNPGSAGAPIFQLAL